MDIPDTRQAACYGIPTDMFFPRGDEQALLAAAKRVCRNCPIADACLQYAVANHMQGVWGGTSELERDRIRHGRPQPKRWTATASTRRRIVQLDAEGDTARQIGVKLGVSMRTVGRHLAAARQVAA